MGRESTSSRNREKFALGIDYGTESGRVAVVRVSNGEIVSSIIHTHSNYATSFAPLAFIEQYIDNLRRYHAIALDVGDRDRLRLT